MKLFTNPLIYNMFQLKFLILMMKNALFWLIKEMDPKMLTFVFWLLCLLLKNHLKLLSTNGFMILLSSEITAKTKIDMLMKNLNLMLNKKF